MKQGVYQWIIGLLIAVTSFLFSGYIFSDGPGQKLIEHTKIEGHPVLVERVGDLEENQNEIKAVLIRIEKNQINMSQGLTANRELKEEIMNKLERIDNHINE